MAVFSNPVEHVFGCSIHLLIFVIAATLDKKLMVFGWSLVRENAAWNYWETECWHSGKNLLGRNKCHSLSFRRTPKMEIQRYSRQTNISSMHSNAFRSVSMAERHERRTEKERERYRNRDQRIYNSNCEWNLFNKMLVKNREQLSLKLVRRLPARLMPLTNKYTIVCIQL